MLNLIWKHNKQDNFTLASSFLYTRHTLIQTIFFHSISLLAISPPPSIRHNALRLLYLMINSQKLNLVQVYQLSIHTYLHRYDTTGQKPSQNCIKIYNTVHRYAFCQSSFRWIYYYSSNKSTGKETGKTHLCAVFKKVRQAGLNSL